jgi:hypothetical protein
MLETKIKIHNSLENFDREGAYSILKIGSGLSYPFSSFTNFGGINA